MYPHNFNIIFMWNPITSDLLREWFLTAISEGIASDDQKSLHSKLPHPLHLCRNGTEYLILLQTPCRVQLRSCGCALG